MGLWTGKGSASEGDAAPGQLPGPLASVIPAEVRDNALQYFVLSGLVLAFLHRETLLGWVRRVFRLKR